MLGGRQNGEGVFRADGLTFNDEVIVNFLLTQNRQVNSGNA